jgi:hypothetical protein
MLESDEVKSLKEIAEYANIYISYVNQMVIQTCLSPDIVTVILENKLSEHITLFELAFDPAALWVGAETGSPSSSFVIFN